MKTPHVTTVRIRGTLKGAVLGIFGAALIASAAVAVVWPLWYLATVHTGIYTLLMLAAIVGGLVYIAYGKIKRHKADSANASNGQ